jgi:protein phosphatase
VPGRGLELIRDAAQASEKGPYRRRNEDFALADPARGLFVVADGLGGAIAGDRASRVAVEAVAALLGDGVALEELVPERTIRDAVMAMAAERDPPDGPAARVRLAILAAHCRVLADARANACVGMATALVVAWAGGPGSDRWWIGHVGDCRAYAMDARGDLRRLTEDHSLSAALAGRRTMPRGLERSPYLQSRLTQVVGGEQVPAPDLRPFRPSPGGRLLLCSDGVWNHVSSADLADVVHRDDPPGDVCETLVQRALNGGSRDNLTALVVVF